jgi:Transcriptional regulators
MEDEKTALVVHTFEKVMNSYLATEKRPHDYGVGFPLYRSEIHTIDAVGRQEQINITELAQTLGITKSATSQMIDRLVKKGLVVKTVLSKSDTEVALTLTSVGQTVFRVHQESHQVFFAYIKETLSTVSERDIDTFLDIMEKLRAFIDL